MEQLGLKNSDNITAELLFTLKKATGRDIDQSYKKDFINATHNKNTKDLITIDDNGLWTLIFNNAKFFSFKNWDFSLISGSEAFCNGFSPLVSHGVCFQNLVS